MRAFIATYLENPDRPLRINDLPRYALGDSQAEHFERLSGKALTEMSRKEVNELRGRVQEWFVNTRPEDVFVKTHNIIAKAGQMPLISPSVTAGAIYIVRNPLDVAISLAHHFQIPLDRAIEILCDRASVLPASETTVEQYVASWSRNARSWLNAQGLVLHVTRYEDMRRKPFKAFEGHKDGRAFFREGRVGAWRESLSAAQVARVIEAHRPLMCHFGYLDEANQPV
jgi:hypothetical protein